MIHKGFDEDSWVLQETLVLKASPQDPASTGASVLARLTNMKVVLHVHGQAPTMAIGNMSIPDDVRLPTCEHF